MSCDIVVSSEIDTEDNALIRAFIIFIINSYSINGHYVSRTAIKNLFASIDDTLYLFSPELKKKVIYDAYNKLNTIIGLHTEDIKVPITNTNIILSYKGILHMCLLYLYKYMRINKINI